MVDRWLGGQIRCSSLLLIAPNLSHRCFLASELNSALSDLVCSDDEAPVYSRFLAFKTQRASFDHEILYLEARFYVLVVSGRNLPCRKEYLITNRAEGA